MEDQLTVRFPRELAQALRRRAERMQRKPSEVVRMAVKEFLEIPEEGRDLPANRAGKLLGSLASGVPDLAVRHREYLITKIQRGR